MTRRDHGELHGKRHLRRALLASVSLACCDVASAQTQGDRIEEIVVTARRRAEDIQKVPISLTAITADGANARNAVRLRDLQGAVPNLAFVGTQSGNSLQTFSVRGIQSQSRYNIGFESGISVYVDGVVIGNSVGFNQELYDVERVEFLRGPQGTLFGKNSVAGAINITTREPAKTFRADAQVEFGNYSLFEARGYMSIPIIEDKLYATVSGSRLYRGGQITNAFTNSKVDNEDMRTGRAKLRFTPTDKLSITFSADTLSDKGRPADLQSIAGYGALPGAFKTNTNTPRVDNREVSGGVFTVNYDLDSGARLTSITGYRTMTSERRSDTDVGPLSVVDSFINYDQKQWSQELRLTSPSEGPLQYVGGLYAYHQDIYSNSVSCFGSVAGVPAFLRNVCGNTAGTIDTDSYAAFASLDWRIAERVTLTAGLRYTHEKKLLDYLQNGFPNGVAPSLPQQQDRQKQNELTPTFGARWEITDKAMLYATASKGFKGGGWNVDNITAAALNSFTKLKFGPESLWNYEAGVKTSWFENRLTANLSAFYADYTDLQVTNTVPTGVGGGTVGVTNNAGSARVKGFEVEVAARPVRGLELGAGLGYANARYTDYRDITTASAPLSFDGKRLNNAPLFTANLSAQYTARVHDRANLVLRADWSGRSDYYVARENTPDQKVSGYSLLNGRIGLTDPNSRWDLFLWANNVLDKQYIVLSGTGGFAFPGVGSNQLVAWGRRRTIGLEAAVHF